MGVGGCILFQGMLELLLRLENFLMALLHRCVHVVIVRENRIYVMRGVFGVPTVVKVWEARVSFSDVVARCCGEFALLDFRWVSVLKELQSKW
jgi:hypothetical protein